MTEMQSAHVIDDPKGLETEDVLNRLVRVSQKYKVGLLHALNTNDLRFNLRNLINNIDYQ